MKQITVNQLAKGLYLVKTDGSEGNNFPPIFNAMRWQIESAGFPVSLVVEPIGQDMQGSPVQTAEKPKRAAVSVRQLRLAAIGKAQAPTKDPIEKRCQRLLRLVVVAMNEGRFWGYPHKWDVASDRIYVRISDLLSFHRYQEQQKPSGDLVSAAHLRRELLRLGLIEVDAHGAPTVYERKVKNYTARVGYMVALKLTKLADYLDSTAVR